MKFLVLNLLVLTPLFSNAETGTMTIYGKLLSFNSSTATIKAENGAQVIVPREAVTPSVEGVLVGRGMVQANLELHQLLSLNPKINSLLKNNRKPSSKNH